MMPLGLWNINWLNQNKNRSFPLSEHATRQVALDPNITLPNDFLLAMKFSYHAGHNVRPDKFYVSAVSVTSAGCQIRIGYADGETKYDMAMANIPADSDQIEYTLTGINRFSDTVGYIAVNMYQNITRMPSGFYTFDPEATPIEPACVTPMLRGVTSLVVNNRGKVSERLVGDVILEAGANIILDVVKGGDASRVIISAVDATNFEETCECCVDATMPAITSINGIYPDSDGDIQIVCTDCMNMSAGNNSLIFEDTCAEPCCGCDELAALRTEVTGLRSGSATLNSFVNSLSTTVRDTRMIIATSSTGDGCCEPEE